MANPQMAHQPLNDKIALVLGGGGGLGSSVLRRLSGEGCRVYATVRSEPDVQRTESPGSFVTILKADCEKEEDLRNVFDTIMRESGRVDIMVNTIGGYLPQKPLTEVSVPEWDHMMNTNLKVSFVSTREALRRMKGQEYGRIIHMSAMAGLRPLRERAPYAISKAAVSLLTELAGEETKGSGITVNAIAPWIIASQSDFDAARDNDASHWVTPAQIGDIIVSLCSPASAAINGTTIRAFGGRSAGS